MAASAGDKADRRVHGKSQRCATYDVEREMSTHVNPGQADGRDGDQGESAAGRAEMRKGGGAESDRNASVPGQVP